MSEVRATTRAQAIATASALVAGLLLPGGARAASRAGGDRQIVRRLLLLEHLQEAFYTEAERIGALTGAGAAAVEILGGVERAHVAALRQLAGSAAPKRPRFDFRGTTEADATFARTAVSLEELTVAGTTAQLARVRSAEVLQAVVEIHTVEARHAAWMRSVAGMPPAPDAFDAPGDGEVPARFLDIRPHTVARRAPSFPA